MRRVVLAFTLVALYLSGSTALAQVTATWDLLIGTWETDRDAMMAGELQGMSPEEAATLAAMMEGAFMRVTLHADGTMVMVAEMMGESATDQGTWALVGTEGPTATITVTEADGQTEQILWTFFDDSNAVVTIDGQTTPLTWVPSE